MTKRIMALLLTLLMIAAANTALALVIEVADDDLSVTEGLDENVTNILLLGSDSRTENAENGRSDAIIVASIHRETGAIKLTSLYRDMWVTISGASFEDKLNTAYRYGGPNLAMKMVNEILELNITQYVVINFSGLSDMIDHAGGVTLELTSVECGAINRTVESEKKPGETAARLSVQDGEHTLSGTQALAFARLRNIDSGFARDGRHRRLLIALADKIRTLSLLEQIDFVTTGLQYVTTNLSLADTLELSFIALRSGLQDIRQLELPSQGNYRYGSGDGPSRVIFDQTQVRDEAHAFIYD
ncbi:MAG: LCP family protein [Clostridia bacterium]|nr:LCP family protein [Clostridia bacterium]